MTIEAYIEKYGRRLYGLCRSLIGGDADDLYQETWLRAYMKLDTYKDGMPFEAWLSSICVNAYRDEMRRRRRRYENEIESDEKDAIIESISEESGTSSLELREAVGKLPPKLRETVILYYYNGYDEKTTARILKIPVGTVKSRLNAAKTKLKGALTDEEL